jgi:hypothetical protein
MNETLLFIWGLIAFALAIGPLMVAAALDRRDKSKETE